MCRALRTKSIAMEEFLNGRVKLHCGDCREVLAQLEENSLDACVTDPPYHLTSIVKRFGAANSAPVRVGDINASNDLKAAYARQSAGFMGKLWDGGDIAFDPETWRAVYRVLKPGAHLLAMGSTRTYHRLACAIEDAGFEVRDTIMWIYGSGFPKSHDVSKGIDRAGGDALAWKAFSQEYDRVVTASQFNHSDIDRMLGIKSSSCYWARTDHRGGMPPRHHWEKICALLSLPAEFEQLYDEAEREIIRTQMQGRLAVAPGQAKDRSTIKLDITAPATDAARQWDGWGTALKPACEPIVLARKPLSESTVAANVLKWGTGAINVDGCRVKLDGEDTRRNPVPSAGWCISSPTSGSMDDSALKGRWPANIIHDGSDEVVAAFPDAPGQLWDRRKLPKKSNGIYGDFGEQEYATARGDIGSAARFFYTAKADADDRLGSKHPTVKPLDLMQYLVRLVTPPKGTVLDPFAGTGTTGEAAWREGMAAVLIEAEAEYCADIRRRMALALSGPDERARESIKAKNLPRDDGPLFSGISEAAE
jgi:DNA modification methylase